jgi:hypothetical protein
VKPLKSTTIVSLATPVMTEALVRNLELDEIKTNRWCVSSSFFIRFYLPIVDSSCECGIIP